MQGNARSQQSMMILWWIFISTAVLYGVVGWFATDHAWGTGTLWPDALSAKFWLLAAVSAIASFGLMFWRVPEKAKSLNGQQDVNGPFVRFMFRAGFAEVPALIGLVLLFMTEDFRHLAYLGPVSLVLLIINRPSLAA